MRQIGESYSTSSHMLHPTLVTMPRSENIQHLLFIVRTGFSKAKSANGRFAQTIQPSKWHCNEILATHWSGEQLRIPCTSGNSHGSSFCNIKKRSKFTSQEHHKNSQKFTPFFPASLKQFSQTWQDSLEGGSLGIASWRKMDPKEMTATWLIFRLLHGRSRISCFSLAGAFLAMATHLKFVFLEHHAKLAWSNLLLNKKWQQFTIDMTHYPKNNTSISWPLNFEKFYPFHLQLQLLEQLIPTFLEFDQVWDRSLEGHATANQPTKSCATRATLVPWLGGSGIGLLQNHIWP